MNHFLCLVDYYIPRDIIYFLQIAVAGGKGQMADTSGPAIASYGSIAVNGGSMAIRDGSWVVGGGPTMVVHWSVAINGDRGSTSVLRWLVADSGSHGGNTVMAIVDQ